MVVDGNNSDSVNRRAFLNTLGTASGGAVVGMSGVGSASSSSKATTEEIERTLESDQVQSVLKAFNGLPVKRNRATHSELVGDEYEYEITRLPTPVGELSYFTRDDGTDEAILRLGNSNGNSKFGGINAHKRQYLPEKYHGIPAESEAVYISGEGGEALHRSPTPREEQALAEVVDAERGSLFSFAYDSAEGFLILVSDGNDESGAAYSVRPNDGGEIGTAAETESTVVYREVSNEAISNARVSSFDGSDGVQTQDWGLKECASVCTGCVTAARICYKCAVPCAGSVSGIGAIACAICLVGTCGATVAGCYGCYDKCKHHVS